MPRNTWATTALTDLQRRGRYTAALPVPTAAALTAGMRDGPDPQRLLDPDELDLVGVVRAQLQQYTDRPL